jgi:N-acetyl-beta-hexosaminidase
MVEWGYMGSEGSDFEMEALEPQIEALAAQIKEKVDEVVELVEMDFIGVGEDYALEQMLNDPYQWEKLNVKTRELIIFGVGAYLGVDLVKLPKEQITRRYHEKGVKGQRSEGGAEVVVMKTAHPQIAVHVFDYANPELGTRYNLVRES